MVAQPPKIGAIDAMDINANSVTGFACSLLIGAGCLQGVFIGAARAEPGDDAFYHQLLKIPKTGGYRPTRNFAIVTDSEHGNQLVADDDEALRFNQLWLQQYQPGYKDRKGGAAFGEIFRAYLRTAYRNYRAEHAQQLSGYPDESGSIQKSVYSTTLDYNIKVTDDEVRFKVEYEF